MRSGCGGASNHVAPRFLNPASPRRIHPPPFGLPPFGLKGRRFDGQAKRLLYSGQTWKSYVGILQRMPKPGSFASIACTLSLSEHLRARPKHFHLQGGTGLPISSICMITNTIQPFAAQPQGLHSLYSILSKQKTAAPMAAVFCYIFPPITSVPGQG